MRIAIVAVSVLMFGSGAYAQHPSDCNGQAFPLRSFPQKIVENHAAVDSGDPLNTVVGKVYGRCYPGNVDLSFVCGAYARRNRAGYIDNARDFYGEYRYSAPSFKILARDAAARRLCAQKVL